MKTVEGSRTKLVLISWNVASWSTSLKLIRQHYGSLGSYLDRHQVDVLCLQETKIQRERVSEHNISGCSEKGWESYWCCCNQSGGGGTGGSGSSASTSTSKRGFNGVATFARKGLVKSACGDIFEEEELDNEGRCIVTDLGKVVVFNVYIPTSGMNYSKIPFKMRYLRRLREKMRQLRETGKKVVLVGDLNIAPGAMDVYWRDKLVKLEEIERRAREASRGSLETGAAADHQEDHKVLQVIQKVGELVPRIRARLRELKIVKIPGKGGSKPEQANRYARKEESWKAVIQSETDEKEIKIGKTFDHSWSAELRLGLKELHVHDEESGERFLVWSGGLSVQHLGDLMNKALGSGFSESELKIVAKCFGYSYYAPCLIDFFNDLVTKDHMVDTFGAKYSNQAEERFTCWEQYTNARYENKGVRLDFVLLDEGVFDSCVKDEDYRLDGGCEKVKATSEEAAFRCATAWNKFQPAPFDGSGIADPPMSVYDMQFTKAHNGIVYTPPRYS